MRDEVFTDVKPRIINYYASRRMYDLRTRSMVTLGKIAEMIRAGDRVVIQDKLTGADITHVVLAGAVHRTSTIREFSPTVPVLEDVLAAPKEVLARLVKPNPEPMDPWKEFLDKFAACIFHDEGAPEQSDVAWYFKTLIRDTIREELNAVYISEQKFPGRRRTRKPSGEGNPQ